MYAFVIPRIIIRLESAYERIWRITQQQFVHYEIRFDRWKLTHGKHTFLVNTTNDGQQSRYTITLYVLVLASHDNYGWAAATSHIFSLLYYGYMCSSNTFEDESSDNNDMLLVLHDLV